MMFFLSLIFSLFLFVPRVQAIYDPLSVPNNRYGIHIVDTNDIQALPKLVNFKRWRLGIRDYGFVRFRP